jgi:hypothetical protein
MSPSFSRFFYKRLLARDFRVDEVVGLCETRDDLAQEMRNLVGRVLPWGCLLTPKALPASESAGQCEGGL